jgi:hypothetical protein
VYLWALPVLRVVCLGGPAEALLLLLPLLLPLLLSLLLPLLLLLWC